MYITMMQDTMMTKKWLEIQKAGEAGVPILFPLGVVEEHGPHLPLCADVFWSYQICKRVKGKFRATGQESMIAPPYYWGINYCTGGFPGSFSLKPETMTQVLFEIFGNLKSFGFTEVYCFSYHGDAFHVKAIVEAIKKANAGLDMHVSLVLESMDLRRYGWNGTEDFLLVSEPAYPMEWFMEEESAEAGLCDIHAGAFETAVLNYFCPDMVDLEKACQLQSTSLNGEGMKRWLRGGDATKEVVPLGYAGNPADYEKVSRHVEEMIELQVTDIADRILQKRQVR